MGLAAGLLGLACSRAGIEVASADDIESAIGTRAQVVGEAANAKLSAVVLVDEQPIYLFDRKSWSDSELGDTVKLDCVLKKTEDYEMRSVDGAMLQGTERAIVYCERAPR